MLQVSVDNLIATQHVGKRSGQTANLIQHFARGVRSVALPCSRAGTEEVQMLAGVTATFAAGTSTLILGAPGSGKSTLLRAVSGRLYSRDPAVGAAVRFSGATLDELKSQRGIQMARLAAYAPQVRGKCGSGAFLCPGHAPVIFQSIAVDSCLPALSRTAARRAPDLPYGQGGPHLRPRVLRCPCS